MKLARSRPAGDGFWDLVPGAFVRFGAIAAETERGARVRRSSLLALDDAGIELRTGEQVERIGLDDVASLGITLSALVGRLVVTGRSSRIDLRFPAPLAGGAAAWLRSARRAVANR